MALTAEAIVTTARSLLTRYGLQDVSMRRLARELDVAPGALYYHVANKQELLTQVAHRILAPLEEPDGGPVEILRRFRELVLPTRDAGDLLLLAYALDPGLRPAHLVASRLRAEGHSAEEADRLAGVAMRFALGALATEQNRAQIAPSQAQDQAAVQGQRQRQGEEPLLSAESVEAADIYVHGLTLLLSRARSPSPDCA